jgi:hypothetical protein
VLHHPLSFSTVVLSILLYHTRSSSSSFSASTFSNVDPPFFVFVITIFNFSTATRLSSNLFHGLDDCCLVTVASIRLEHAQLPLTVNPNRERG